jgi:TPR repeat protein
VPKSTSPWNMNKHPTIALAMVPNARLTRSRHAWGIEANQEQAVHYLSMAASNSAEVEKLALGAGMKKGGSAKGELVLAMYELANCFRNGWGIKKDPAAAKQYYETAANLGDTDAMNEVAWCYTEGFGTKKDKVCLRSTLLHLHCRHS